MFETFALGAVDADVVLREWLKPTPACTVPAGTLSRETPWTVIGTPVGDCTVYTAISGDMPQFPDAYVSSDIAARMKITARMEYTHPAITRRT